MEYNIEPYVNLGTCGEDKPCHTFWINERCTDIVGGRGAPKCHINSEYAVFLNFSGGVNLPLTIC